MAQRVRSRLERLEALKAKRGRPKPVQVVLFFDDGDGYITDARTGERYTEAEWARLHPNAYVIRLSVFGDEDGDDAGV